MTVQPAIRRDLFGLSSTPFARSAHEPFLDQNRRECLEGLQRFLEYRGFAAIAGCPGTGKTALIRHFTGQLHSPSHKIMYLAMAEYSANDLLRAVCSLLDIEASFHKSKTLVAIQNRLQALGRTHPVLVLDEMHNAAASTMEALRLLAADRFDASKTLSCIMLGTEAFFDKLRLTINESLRQRVTFFHVMTALDEAACNEFLRWSLDQAGASQEVFVPDAAKLIHDLSNGVLRLVNTLAAAALANASDRKSPKVELADVRQAQRQCLLPKMELKL